ncbi:MAG: type 4a pilus biogenesis protein PilO [Mariprofundaceae bacterium]|nr:type 4a pilus biogenesis protein PilO [Mariprofundaceae bacterium]
MISDALNLSQLEMLRPILPFPLWQKAFVLVAGFVLLLAAYAYLGWMPLQDDIARAQKNVGQQQKILARNLKLANDLPRKKKEFATLEKQLKIALNILPGKAQIPDLLEGVSRSGKDAGLEFSTFKPLAEVDRQFYAEVPVNFSVTGTYRQLVTFLKHVGQMPRIVDVKNLTLATSEAEGQLTVTGQAVTYRFIEGAGKKKSRRRHKGAGR